MLQQLFGVHQVSREEKVGLFGSGWKGASRHVLTHTLGILALA
jgi:hypothetical protein